ncbi:disease resistance protein RGA2-like [Carya illinoinensis]|uniref:disease resistance protein RGA2-like n=1 Tax=Carya illinoinensis TaxID=32201 RepID=UPI001C718C21|nr:disease resistance protein RGA2-like [Carya illinoinensis]
MVDIVSSLAASLLQKFGSLVYQEFCLAWGVQSDLQKLESTISDININELLDAEYKQASNPMLRNWLGRLKVVLSDAEDVIDEIEYKVLRKQAIRAYRSTSSKLPPFVSHE